MSGDSTPKQSADAVARAPLSSPDAYAGHDPDLDLAAPSVIRIRGARTHNLRGIDLDLPRGKLVVVTGPPGSGKSSLAFDTIFAEGQRRYVESLSASARQHLAQLPKPDADLIEGLSPAVAIAQHAPARNPRSTVGTTTEIYDFLRLLFARVGTVHSPVTGQRMHRYSIESMVEASMALTEGTRLSVLAPVVRAAAGAHSERLDDLRRRGFVRVHLDGEVRDLGEAITLDPEARHDIAVYVDRLKMKPGLRARLTDSIEIAAGLSGGLVEILTASGETMAFSERYADLEHGVTFPELTPSLFSFNSPSGACPSCGGLGTRRRLSPTLIVDASAGLGNGAIRPWRRIPKLSARLAGLAKHFGVEASMPWDALPEEVKIVVLEGSGEQSVGDEPFVGVRPWLQARLQRRLENRAGSSGTSADGEDTALNELLAYTVDTTCADCDGVRLRAEALMVRVGGETLPALCGLPLSELRRFFAGLSFDKQTAEIAAAVLDKVRGRLAFLEEVGLSYLTLSRATMTLSGGEAQRIRLATQIG